jgi:ADP-heptose:LPS heptosyltransferase
VATHFKGAPSFFKSLNIKVDQYYFYSNKEEYRAIRNLIRKHGHTYVCPRTLFFKASPFGNPVTSKHTKRKTIGIHAGASSLGSHKAIPGGFTNELLAYLNRENYKIILFGTTKELSQMQGLKNKDIVFASDKNIIKNLALVNNCDLLIGSDSVFKTMASMLKKPTIVLHQNIKNNFRDRVFITPYINEQLMYVYKYTNFNKTDMKSALQFISNVMNLELNNS